MRRLIEKSGADATVAPSMQEVPLTEESQAGEFAQQLLAGAIDVCVFMTGVGADALFKAMELDGDFEKIRTAFNATTIVVRGPKPVKVLRERSIDIDVRAPEPNTWREILTELSAQKILLENQTVAVQEYGIANQEFYSELRQRGANVRPVTIYRWKLPDDVGPLESAIKSTLNNEFDIIMFTSAQQVRNLLTVADQQRDAWLAAARNCCIASIGPTCSEALRGLDLPPDFEASPPKMGHLVRDAIEFYTQRKT